MVLKRVVRMKGFSAIDFNSDPLGQRWVKIKFSKRSRLGKLLKIRKERIVKVPKGMRVILIENHKPKVRSVTIVFQKIKGRKPKK